jgi:hypothetical protein
MAMPGQVRKKPTADSVKRGWQDIVRWDPATKQIGTPGAAIERACRDLAALKKMSSQRMSVTKLILSGFFVDEDFVPFVGIKPGAVESFEKAPQCFVLTACYRNPRSGVGVSTRLGVRAGWRLRFTLNVVHDELSEEMVRTILEEAGSFMGIGSWRPRYGRFRVVKFEEIRQAKAA